MRMVSNNAIVLHDRTRVDDAIFPNHRTAIDHCLRHDYRSAADSGTRRDAGAGMNARSGSKTGIQGFPVLFSANAVVADADNEILKFLNRLGESAWKYRRVAGTSVFHVDNAGPQACGGGDVA